MEHKTIADDCIFCKSRLHTKICQLPYELAKNYKNPGNDIEEIMAITEIHTHYGLPGLQANLQFTRQILDNEHMSTFSMRSSTGTQTDQFETSILSTTDDSEREGTDKQIASQQSEQNDEEEEKTPVIQKPSTKEATSRTKEKKVKARPIPLKSYASIAETFKEESAMITNVTIANTDEREQPKVSKTQQDEQTLNVDDIEHLTEEIMLILIYSNRSDENFSHTKVEKLITAFDTELEIRKRIKEAYKPSMLTNLDHPVLLAKEMVARHTVSDFKEWECGKRITTHKHCILNQPTLSSTNEDTLTTRLIDTLIEYSGRTVDEYESTSKQGQQIRRLLQSKLEARGYEIYSWFRTKWRRLQAQNEPRIETERNKTRPNLLDYQKTREKEEKPKQKHGPHTCPSIEENLLNYLETKVEGIVKTTINEYEGRLPTLKGETKLSSLLTEMIKEFVKHNQGWRNKTSMQTIDHVKKVEHLCSIELTESNRSGILLLLMRALGTIRKEQTKNN